MGLTWCSRAKRSQAGLHMLESPGSLSSPTAENQARASHLRRVFAPGVSHSTVKASYPRINDSRPQKGQLTFGIVWLTEKSESWHKITFVWGLWSFKQDKTDKAPSAPHRILGWWWLKLA